MAYIGSRPDNVISRNAQNEYNYTATGGQTTFTGADSNNNTLSYTPGNIEVYFNGARLEESDFTATNGTSIVLANAAVVNDELSIVAIRVFEVGSISNFNTSDLAEGSNLYFTNARADARIAAADTNDLSEGNTNLYFTNARADARAQLKVDAIVGSAPGTLDTLQELGDALGDDPNFATTVTNSIAAKLPLAGGTMTGNVSFGDNDKAVFGGLLEIYGDGTHARIREYGSGQMKIQGDNMQLLTSAGTSTYLEGNASTGAVTLYHLANAPRITTTASGVDVTGTVTSDGLTVDLPNITDVNIDGTDGGGIQFKNSGAEQFRLDSASNDGALYHTPSGKNHTFKTDGASRLKIATGGDISFYEDTGTTAKFFWDASAESVQLGGTLNLQAQGSNVSTIGNNFVLNSGYKYLTSGAANMLYFDAAGNTMFFKASSGTAGNAVSFSETMRIDSSGNVGIGTNNPSSELHIEKAISGDQSQFRISNGTGATLRMGITGSDTNEHAHIKTNSAENLEFHIGQAANSTSPNVVFKSGGNVGIGNVNPVHPLHIYEDGGYYASIGRGNSTPGGSDPWLGLFNNTNIANATFGWGIYDSNANGSFQIWNKNNNTTGYNALTILRGGNVGIGTNSPGTSMHLFNGTQARFAMQSSSRRFDLMADSDGFTIRDQSAAVNRFKIDTSGNVGIGTTNPTSNLHVDGSIVSTNLAQGTGELQIQGYGATGYINMSGSGSLRFRMGSSYTEHMSLAPGGQLLASAAGRYTGLNSNSWVTFGRLYGAQSTPLNIKVIVGHNSSGGYNEFTNDTYAYNIAAGTVVTIGNTTGGYTCQIRKIKRIGGQNGIPGAHYNGGDGGWEYQVARNQAYGMSVGIHVMGATTGWTWTI